MTDPAREQQSEAVKACAESVMRDNPDLTKEQAFKICQDMENEGQLKAPEGVEEPDLSADDPPPHRLLQADFSDLPAVRRNEEGDDVRFRNLVLIGAGEWTDMRGHTEYYTERALQKIAKNPDEMITDTSVNVNHEHQDQLLQVGHIDRSSIEYQNGLLLGDIVLYGDKQAGKDTIADMDRALESDGEHGAGGFSIQIPQGGFTRQYNAERGLYELTEFKVAGGGFVTEGASGPANLDEQLPNRAVALSTQSDTPVRVLSPGDTTKAAMRQSRGMDTIDDLETLRELGEDAELLYPDGSDEPTHALADGETVKIDIEGASIDDIREALGGGDREMQEGEMDMAQDLIERAESEGFDTSTESAAALIEFIQANLDPSDEEVAALQDVADAYLQAVEAESLDATPAEGLLDFIAEQGGADTGEEPEENEEEMAGLKSEVEELRELAAQVPDLKAEIEALQDRPDYGERPESEGDGDGERRPVESLGGLATDGEYFSR